MQRTIVSFSRLPRVSVTAVTQRISLVAPDSFNHDKDNFMTCFKRIFSLVLATFALAGTAAPSFAEVVYNVTNYENGQNGWSLAGTITASGTGTFTNASAITAWDFTATKLGESRRYSSSTSTSNLKVFLDGTLNATPTTLSLPVQSTFFVREEPTGTSEISWQNQYTSMGTSSNYSAGWITDGTMWSNYSGGAPIFSPIVDGALTLGTAVGVPEPSTYAMALAGLACGGYTMFRRRKRA